jgi:hypothetical protein
MRHPRAEGTLGRKISDASKRVSPIPARGTPRSKPENQSGAKRPTNRHRSMPCWLWVDFGGHLVNVNRRSKWHTSLGSEPIAIFSFRRTGRPSRFFLPRCRALALRSRHRCLRSSSVCPGQFFIGHFRGRSVLGSATLATYPFSVNPLILRVYKGTPVLVHGALSRSARFYCTSSVRRLIFVRRTLFGEQIRVA